jgi:serine/threonine protein phosphatase PrpC
MSLSCEIVPFFGGVKEVGTLSKENIYKLYNLDMAFNACKEDDVRLNSCVKLSQSGQDFVTSGRYGHPCDPLQSFSWIVLADGHGSNRVIDMIKGIDWSEFVKEKDVKQLNQRIIGVLKQKITACSGSTLSIVKIYDDHFDCYYIGDSEIRIYENKQLVFMSPAHNHMNELEMERIKTIKGLEIQKNELSMKIVDDKTITMYKGEEKYYQFSPLDKTNMTRTFGHDQRSLEFMEYTRVERNKESRFNYKVIVGSDGLWDMVSEQDDKFLNNPENNAEKIAEFAHSRWHQKWNFIPNYDIYLNTKDEAERDCLVKKDVEFPKHDASIDDVSVVTWIQ